MELTHRFTVPVPIDDAWKTFNDLELIAPCFPGAALTSFDGDSFEGLCKVKLGPISLQYAGSGRFVERDETAHRAVIEAKGKDKRGNGTAAASITAELASSGDNATDVIVKTDLNITGRPAQFGRGVMQDVSDKLLSQFSACLETKLGGEQAPAEETPIAVEAAVASKAAAAQPAKKQSTAPVKKTAAAKKAAPAKKAAAEKKAAPGKKAAAEKKAAAAKKAAEKKAAPAKKTVPAKKAAPAKKSAPSAESAASTRPASTSTARASSPTPEASASSASSPAAALDLGTTVVPVLLKRYAPHIIGTLIVLCVLRKLLGRSRR